MASIFDNPSAFDPMFDDTVVIRGSRASGSKVEITVSACVFTAADGDPFSEEALDSDREDVSIAVREDDWRYFTAMRRGDRLGWNGRDYAFVSAKHDAVMGWVVKARSTGGAS